MQRSPDAAGCEAHCCEPPVKPNDEAAKEEALDGVGIHQRRGSATRVTTKEEEYCCFNSAEEKEAAMDEKWKNRLWKTCVYAITLSMLVGLLLGLNMSWSAITAALALIVLDFKDAHPCLEKVALGLIPEREIFTQLLMGSCQDPKDFGGDVLILVSIVQPVLEEINAILVKHQLDMLKCT
ncbi:hypothetical protein ZWY2020_021914 [Hordeum vulgare]|nr:hypothetical protein ZWY2020_021914 [Hordeum vulgare]